jgi:alpha-galactosidase
VFNTQDVLADIFMLETGETGVTRHEVETNVVGVNHFTWFTDAACRGYDLFPIYQKFVSAHRDTGILHKRVERHKVFESQNRVKFDLFLRYGSIAAAGDRHLAEFMPGEMYMKDPETVAGWDYALTPVSWRDQELIELLARSKRLAKGEEDVTLEPSGEEGVQLIKALAGLRRMVSNVNIPNCGQIANAPLNAVVESNAVFEYKAVRPVFAGTMPENIAALTAPHFINHELTLDAALNIDFAKAYEAFKNDPLVKGRLTDAQAEVLLRDMIRNTLNYLPEKWAEVVK